MHELLKKRYKPKKLPTTIKFRKTNFDVTSLENDDDENNTSEKSSAEESDAETMDSDLDEVSPEFRKVMFSPTFLEDHNLLVEETKEFEEPLVKAADARKAQIEMDKDVTIEEITQQPEIIVLSNEENDMQVVIENDTEIYQLPFGNSIEKFFDIDKFEKAINEDRELLDEILGEKSEDVEQTFKNKKLEETSEPLISKPPLQEQSEKLHDPTADSPIQCPPFKDQSKELNAIPPIPNLPLHGQSTCNSNILDGPADSHILTSPRNVQWDRRNDRLGHTYMSY
ncbi:uncharacterized protein LOC127277420 [Leptopilina boulardi]|uniref:uncharacterized protein LOC127277420 n=1 Tax=Leptopilina boulardi TaxID=63433 RepID=UPI0021F62ED7|nr:uncharacterized protein LOC127277420 [Leptopilina boulardi]